MCFLLFPENFPTEFLFAFSLNYRDRGNLAKFQKKTKKFKKNLNFDQLETTCAIYSRCLMLSVLKWFKVSGNRSAEGKQIIIGTLLWIKRVFVSS